MENPRDNQPVNNGKAVFYVGEGGNSETLNFNLGGILASMTVD